MKKNDWLLLSSVALYSYLFYNQSAGINFLIFTIFLICCLLMSKATEKRSWGWLISAAGSLISGICVAYYGNTLSLLANIISLSLLSGFSFHPHTSVLFTLLFSLYSYATAVVYMVLDYLERKKKQVSEHSNPLYVRLLLFGLPFMVAMVFFFMYRAANPLFYNLTKNFTLNFISWGWMSFTAGGLVLLYGFFYHRAIPAWAVVDELAPNTIRPNPNQPVGLWGKTWNLDQELTTGIILFVLLNLLLFLVNALDINFLLFDQTLPEGMTYAESVHQGIGMLIASIIIAILIILFYFRGHLNFYSKNRGLKLLAYLWVAQNAILLISTAYRNQFYIEEYSLTYKRIGVYVYLLLAFIGLVTTFIKIMQAKSNWFLFRKNAWVAYVVLIIACAINWDLLITRFNIAQAQTRNKELDKDYLISLSNTNIPDLLVLDEQSNFSVSESENIDLDLPMIIANHPDNNSDYFSRNLHGELYSFLENAQIRSWRAWSYDWNRVKAEIGQLSAQNKIIALDLARQEYQTLTPLFNLKNLYHLNLAENHVQDLKELSNFQKVVSLNLSQNQLQLLRHLPTLPNLKELDVSQNKFKNLEPLAKLPALEKLNLASNDLQSINSIPALPQLKLLNLSGNIIPDLNPIRKFKQLETLLLSHTLAQPEQDLPIIATVNKLDLSNNNIAHYHGKLFENLTKFENLKSLDLSGNYLQYFRERNLNIPGEIIEDTKNAAIKITRHPEYPIPVLPKLEVLNLTNNAFINLIGISDYPFLTNLYLGNNQIQDLTPIATLHELQILDVHNNALTNIVALSSLTNLQELNLAHNKQALQAATFPVLKNLVVLNIAENDLSQLHFLSKLVNLEKLNVSQNKLSDLSTLPVLLKLKYLDIRGNSIVDYRPLYKLTNLRVLLLNALPDAELAALKEKIPNTKIITNSSDDYAPEQTNAVIE